MKFDVRNRLTGEVQFAAEIDCDDNASISIKLGLAARWAVKSGANLNGANLNGANLNRASLYGASLDGASLDRASLYGARLNGASLDRASLYDANLNGANLNRASLYGARLNGASLYDANLNGANLNWASLDGASLHDANLNGASLDRASLNGANGVNDWIKCIQIDTWPITYTHDTLQIGCRRHLISEWRDFDDATIRRMDSKALEFWAKYKSWIFQTIELCPAKPTRAEEPAEDAA